MVNQPPQTMPEEWEKRFDEEFPNGAYECHANGYDYTTDMFKRFIRQERALAKAQERETITKKLILIRDRIDATIAIGRGSDELCDAFIDICDLTESLQKEGE